MKPAGARRAMFVTRLWVASLGVFAWTAPVAAQSLLERESVRSYVLEVARDHELDQHRLAGLFAHVQTNEEVLELISRPAEKRLVWHEYRAIFLGDDRIEAGQAFLEAHAATFDAAHQRFGVPPAIVAAIIGVETFYGRITGRFGVLDALATLAFDYPPRSPFFTSELTEFLVLGTREGWDLDQVKGSYAGAMGWAQFISSSYRRYAIDFDEDGQVDLFGSIPDIIGSIANYLAEHNWQRGQRIADNWPDAPPSAEQWVSKRLLPAVVPQALSAAGFKGPGLSSAIDSNAPVSVMQFDTGSGEDTLIGYTNFYAITRYNHSRLYARAVLELAQELDPSMR